MLAYLNHQEDTKSNFASSSWEFNTNHPYTKSEQKQNPITLNSKNIIF
jgi:hypothetical protein